MKLHLIRLTLLIFVLSYSNTFYGQEYSVPAKWQLTDIGIKLNLVGQRLSNVDHTDIYSLVKNKEQFQADMTGFEKASYSSPYFEAERLGLNFSFQKPINNSNWSHEWQVGIGAVLGSEFMVEYESPSQPASNDNYIGWCLINNRIGLELNRVIRYSKNKFSLYAGGGVNLSASFNDEVLIFTDKESFDSDIELKAESTQFLTFNGMLGGSYDVSKKISIQGDITYGFGRFMREYKMRHKINQSIGVSLGLKYRLPNRDQ